MARIDDDRPDLKPIAPSYRATIHLGKSQGRQDKDQKKEEQYFSEFLAQDTVPLFSATDYSKFNKAGNGGEWNRTPVPR